MDIMDVFLQEIISLTKLRLLSNKSDENKSHGLNSKELSESYSIKMGKNISWWFK